MDVAAPIPAEPPAMTLPVGTATVDEERRLLCAAAAGDQAAFSQLVERLAPRLWRHLVANGASAADADDLVQETFVRVDRHRGRYDRRWAPTTWIWTIARNLAANLARKRPTVPLPADLPAIAPDPEPGGPPPVWTVARRVLDGRAYAALWLRYGEDLADEEIASALATTSGNVRVLLHRARRRLGEALDPALEDR